jgi:hypothetical protein
MIAVLLTTFCLFSFFLLSLAFGEQSKEESIFCHLSKFIFLTNPHAPEESFEFQQTPAHPAHFE